MIAFIVIAMCILVYTIFAEDGLIASIKDDRFYYNSGFLVVLKNVWSIFWVNVGLNIVNFFCVVVISFLVFLGCAITQPSITSEWSFNINALQDNLVTEGEFHGSLYGGRGYIDGELSYFYSRTLSYGEKIEHIPAKKTYIKYDNNVHPHVEVHQTSVDIPEWLSKVFFLNWINGESTSYYVIVAPEGTISSSGQYKIDMQ